MDQFVRFLRLESGHSQTLPLWEALLALGLALVCSILIALVYRKTHTSLGYSPNYVHSLILTSMVTTLIMVVIGSNIARAFSLVGALSIIRFRNAIKETRDVGFIFFAMAIAMACGTRFYALALAATAMICFTMLALHALQFGARQEEPHRLLRVRMPSEHEPLELLENVFEKLFTSYALVFVETAKQGLYTDAVFSVRQIKGVKSSEILTEIRAVNSNLKVRYDLGLHDEEI